MASQTYNKLTDHPLAHCFVFLQKVKDRTRGGGGVHPFVELPGSFLCIVYSRTYLGVMSLSSAAELVGVLGVATHEVEPV